jgi:hypothetical protein
LAYEVNFIRYDISRNILDALTITLCFDLADPTVPMLSLSMLEPSGLAAALLAFIAGYVEPPWAEPLGFALALLESFFMDVRDNVCNTLECTDLDYTPSRR